MTDEELWWAALRRAPNMGESREVARLREFTHAEMMAGRIEAETQDRIGELLNDLARRERSAVGDLIGPNAVDIPWDALEVVSSEGDHWRRAFGEDRYAREDDGYVDRDQEYDWITVGGWSTTEGLLAYAPLKVTRIAAQPT